MLDKIERRLLAIHIGVFLCVLSILAFAVFAYFEQSLQQQVRDDLSKLADSVIASIDFDEVGRHDAGIPDSIASVMPVNSSQSLMDMRFQWFDANGHLSADKGQFDIKTSFSARAGFQEQRRPHALLLTRPATMNDKLLGYVRVVRPLQATDEVVHRLLTGLIVGIAFSAVVSAIGIMWLVRQSMLPIKEMVGRLKQFTADASHELGSPLTVIKSNSHVALKYPDDMRESDREKFEAIRDASDQMARLTDALLAMAGLEDSPLNSKESCQSVNLSELCHKILDRQTDVYGCSIQVNALLPQSLAVCAETTDLERLFGNIVGNAFQYTPAGGTIAIKGSKEGSCVVVSVRDTGIGIAPTDVPHIFERFWRADKARGQRTGGNGLGLAISKAVAAKYNGTIEVESRLGSGSCFTIRLPSA